MTVVEKILFARVIGAAVPAALHFGGVEQIIVVIGGQKTGINNDYFKRLFY